MGCWRCAGGWPERSERVEAVVRVRGCDVCGRRPRWIWCAPHEEDPAVFCGFHAKAYIGLVEIPERWLKPAREYQVGPLARRSAEV